MLNKIKTIHAREILNAKGYPTVEVEIVTEGGARGVGSAPRGTSKGNYEPVEVLDGGQRYLGLGVLKAVDNVNEIIAPTLIGKDVTKQDVIDALMIELDGTTDKSRLGANAILPVSVAASKVGAACLGKPLYKHLNPDRECSAMPGIVATVISGGSYSSSSLEFEDYMYVLEDDGLFCDRLERLSRLRGMLGELIDNDCGKTAIDGGALMPPLKESGTAFAYMQRAAQELGETNAMLGVDVVANELFDSSTQNYIVAGRLMKPEALLEHCKTLAEKYRVSYWEDMFHEDDFDSFALFRRELPQLQVVGDDLYVTNYSRINKGIALKSTNGIIVKVNQAGTVTETLKSCDAARSAGMDLIVSMRSEETNDDFVADLAVAVGARQVKLGSPVVLERNVKYNRLLQIESELRRQRGNAK